MKIVIDISQIVFEGTGTATYTKYLVKHLLKLNSSKKHDYVLFGTSLRRKSKLEEFAENLKNENLKFQTHFLMLPLSFTNQVWNQIHHVRLERLIGKFDLLHSSDWIQPPTRAKKITTIHDLVVYKHPEFSHPEIVSIQKKKLSWVKKECDLILADSFATQKDIVSELKIPENKIKVVYLAGEDDYISFSQQPEKFRRQKISTVSKKFKLNKYILAIGTKEPRKNLERLITAFKHLNPVDTDLVIAGKSGWGKEITESRNIKTLGFVPQEDLPALLAGASAFAYPSLYEGFGVPIVNAQIVGVPVLTSKLGSLPEVAGKAGLYVDPLKVDQIAGKLKEILSLTSSNRNQLILKGQRQAKEFSWEKTAALTLKNYETVMDH